MNWGGLAHRSGGFEDKYTLRSESAGAVHAGFRPRFPPFRSHRGDLSEKALVAGKERSWLLGQKEDFLHHGKALARPRLLPGQEVLGHRLLPPGVDWVLIDSVPHRLEFSFDMHVEEEKLVAAEDRILRDAGAFKERQHLGPNFFMGLVVRLFRAGAQPQKECDSLHNYVAKNYFG